MPLVIGGLAVAFIALALLTLITVYWLLTKWHDFARQIPVAGGALGQVAQYLQDRNAEIIRDVVGVAHAVISWSIDRINDGFKLLFDALNYGPTAQLFKIIHDFAGLQGFVNGWVTNTINSLRTQITALSGLVNGFVLLNINALNFWRGAMTTTVNGFVIPNINKLIGRMDYVTGLQIPTIQARLGVAEHNLQVTLPAEIAETKTDISAVQREFARTTTAPRTGLLDRVHGLEGDLARVLPWAAAIGLSIPVAANLAKLGRNPCWCSTEGPLRDNGIMEMAILMDLI